MSLKRSRVELSGSAEMIRKARKSFKEMPKLRRIELMVEAGLLTAVEAEQAKKKLSENGADK